MHKPPSLSAVVPCTPPAPGTPQQPPPSRTTHLTLLFCLILLTSISVAQPPPAAPAACAKCHIEALTQPTTFMSHALESVDKCGVLLEHPSITATIGKFTYHIQTAGTESTYSVTDGTESVTMKIAWAMGASFALGQTYILEKDGQLYESRVSWFRGLNGLGITLGDESTTPADILQAAGRQIHTNEVRRCFGCHSTNAVHGRELTLDKLTPGVQCAHCHEGVDAHLAAATAGNHDLAPPPDLHKLIAQSADQTSNFCGQCHRTYAEIAMQPNQGIFNVRFQPYRLTGSKCFDPDDARIGCLACHNPHHDFDPQTVNFDSRCLNCHGGIKGAAGKPGAKSCPVAKEKCVSCHMPKLELPGAHFKFTDHRIRVVKPNEPYPG